MAEPVKCFGPREIKQAKEYREQQEAQNPGKYYHVDNASIGQICVSEIENCSSDAKYTEDGSWYYNPNLHNANHCASELNRIEKKSGSPTKQCRIEVTGSLWRWNKHYRVVCEETKKE